MNTILLKDYDDLMNPKIINSLKVYGKKFLGRNYDYHFGWNDERIYCSELVWKIYKRGLNIEIGKLEKLKDFDLSSSIVKKLLKNRYGKKIPLDETVISPVSMFNSKKLITVLEKN